jgi:AcrR family transcriptional regulator
MVVWEHNDRSAEGVPMARRESRPDPARSLGLLWRTGTRTGRSGLTVDSVVASAIEVADAEGLEAVSMRRVAQQLKVGTMSLYTHVPGKTDLTDLMVDAALGELYADLDEPSRAPGGWRGALMFVARSNWDLYLRHPWLLDVSSARPVLGPHTTAKYEAELRPLDGLGLTDLEMDSVLTLVLTHVQGTARALVGVGRTSEETGMSDAEWWEITAPVLDRLIDGRHFPVSARVGQSAGEAFDAASDPVHAMTFGLEVILDGVATLIARRSG